MKKSAIKKPKIAIACQGGGSETAFTAGVFKALFENNIQDRFDIVSLSGTSGGAICAFFIWYSLKNNEPKIWQRLIDFWMDNTAQDHMEQVFNDLAIGSLSAISKGKIPSYNISPSSTLFQIMLNFASNTMRKQFIDFNALLANHINAKKLASFKATDKAPILVIGSCNILTGRLHQFSSFLEPMKIEHLLASACIPTLFPAISIDKMAYWDGLFSDNPPIDVLIKKKIIGLANIPNEIWVIKINPTTIKHIPREPNEIADRRNTLEGNLSLFQSLGHVESMNNLFLDGAFNKEFLDRHDVQEAIKIPKSFPDDPDKEFHIPMIEMSAKLQDRLSYENKLDRSAANIKLLIKDGENQGLKFLKNRGLI